MSNLIDVFGIVLMLVLAAPYVVALSAVCWDVFKCSKE